LLKLQQAIKPDGVQRGIVGQIISRFEAKGYKLVALKLIWPTEARAAEHYADLSKKPFFPKLVRVDTLCRVYIVRCNTLL
jgi:nucleoside-diphosphate kinase